MRSETGIRKSSIRRRNRAVAGSETRRPLQFSHLWQAIGWLMVAVVVWLSLTPEPPHPPTPWLAWDKAQHALAYGLLMYWFRQAFQPHWRWPLFLLLLGVTLEYLQGLGGVRTSDTNDMIANAIGVVLGLALSYTPLGRLLSRVDAIVGAKRPR